MAKVYDVFTNLDSLQLSELAAETFKVWLKFALGEEEIGGKKLLHPSGRYAAALSWRRSGEHSVAIIADEDIAPEVGAIETGRPEVHLKDHMLDGGHVSKDGHRYRVIPLRPDQWRETPKLVPGMIIDTIGGGRLRSGVARMWAKPRPYVDGSSRYRTMTDKPGSSTWIIPEFHPYAPARILHEILEQEFGR